MDKKNSASKAALWASLGLLALSMLLLLLLNSKITVYSDDYWYGTFFDSGLGGFLRQMLSHYRSTNGRLYVHIIVPVVLLFDTKLFAVLSPVLLALLFWFGARYLNDTLSTPALLLCAALGVLGTMACDAAYLRMTLLWISAYFNYIFPVAAAVLAGWFQQRLYGGKIRSRAFFAAGVVFSFLAGAATEQGAIMTLILLWGGALLQRFLVQRCRHLWTYPAAALAGFLTILLAPGSWERVGRGIDGGFFSFLHPSVFVPRFLDVFRYMQYPSTIVLLTALFLLAALVALHDRRLSRGLLLGFPLAAGQLLGLLLGAETFGSCWMVAGCLVLAVLFLLEQDYWPTGLLLLASLASNGMLIITTLNSERTAFPSIIALLLVLISLLARLLRPLAFPARTGAAAVLALVCIAAWVPTFRGYCASKQIVDKNLAAVEESRQTGVCPIDIDIDPRYRFTMLFEGRYFYDNFRAYYHMDPATQIVFTSRRWKLDTIASESEVYPFPTLEDERGLFFPVEFALASAGGWAEWDWRSSSYTIWYHGGTYHVSKDGALSQVAEDGTMTPMAEDFTLLLPYSKTYTLLYCPAGLLEEYFGLHWTYNAQTGRYFIPRQ